jgi:hypothetical protein
MDVEDFTAVAGRWSISCRTDEPWALSLARFLSDLTRQAKENGCTMVGHIKGVLTAGEDAPLFFSLTSFDGIPRCQGGPLGQAESCTMSINVIVAGMERSQLDGLLRSTLERHFLVHGG